jgi:hypothetical protein
VVEAEELIDTRPASRAICWTASATPEFGMFTTMSTWPTENHSRAMADPISGLF